VEKEKNFWFFSQKSITAYGDITGFMVFWTKKYILKPRIFGKYAI
jgi:hypothetical protein